MNVRLGANGDGDEVGNLIASEEEIAEDRVIAADAAAKTSKLIGEAMDVLTERKKMVIKKRRLLPDGPMALDEVGALLGCTRERVRQIEDSAKTKMRRRILAIVKSSPTSAMSIANFLAA